MDLLRRLVNIAAGLCLGVAKTLEIFGLRRSADPWRNLAGLSLRGENSKFTLAAFGLCAPGTGMEFAGRLHVFLAGEEAARTAVVHERYRTRAATLASADLIRAKFAPDGDLLSLEPLLDPAVPAMCAPAERIRIAGAIIRAANATRSVSSVRRHGRILHLLSRETGGREALDYARRILQGAFLAFETGGSDRFTPPAPAVFRHPGTGLLFFTVRRQENGGVDLWTQFHHAPIDGAPAQKMIRRLQRAIGVCEPPCFPEPDISFRRVECVNDGRGLVHLNGYLDFSKIRELRHRLNDRFCGELVDPVSFGAALLWCMGHQPEFTEARFGFIVPVRATDRFEEGIDYVVTCPAGFMRSGAPADGFIEYARDFARRTREALAGTSRSYRTTRALERLPSVMAQAVMRLNVRARRRTSGTLMVTFLPTATTVLVPTGDSGHEHGIVGIYNIDLPSAGGVNVGAVGIKGAPAVVDSYPAALRRALENALEYFPWESNPGPMVNID